MQETFVNRHFFVDNYYGGIKHIMYLLSANRFIGTLIQLLTLHIIIKTIVRTYVNTFTNQRIIVIRLIPKIYTI